MVKYVLIALGVITGLAFARIPHYVGVYAASGLPPGYKGPKFRYWRDGVEV